MGQDRYVLEGGRQGKTRLNILAHVVQPTTLQLLERAGLRAGMHCLDAGCGGGDVTLELARLVGAEGRVYGFDFDAEIIALDRHDAEEVQLHNVEFQVVDALSYQSEPIYDLVYSRFLLAHLPDPMRGLTNIIHAAKPGGVIAVEDIQFSGYFCYPPNKAFQRYLDLYTQTARHKGADPDVGIKLAAMFHKAGVEQVQVNVVQPAHLEGEGKRISQITLERSRGAMISNGFATQAEVDQIVAELADFAAQPTSLISLPRIFQVWGRRAQDS